LGIFPYIQEKFGTSVGNFQWNFRHSETYFRIFVTYLNLTSHNLIKLTWPFNRPHFIGTEWLWSNPVSRGCDQSERSYWMATCLRHVTRVVTGFTVGFYVGCAAYWVLIGRSHGKLSCFTAVGADEMRSLVLMGFDEVRFEIW